ncbi:anthranilate N-methyltransferase-like [Arachis hypogaea]|uniref:anthranilate N-methyltransferase-like n=1 Tax=Arachis hypogaea TaxID=3818 RepID=UPI003B214F31
MAPASESDAKLLELLKLPQDEEEVDGFLFSQMAWSIVVPMALRTTIELGVFDIIAKEGEGAKLSAKDIVDDIGTKNPEAASMLDRVLRLLASHSLLSCSVVEDPQSSNNLHQRLYSLSPVSKYFLGDADGVSLGPSLWLHLDKVFTQSWNELKGAILEGGIPFNRAHGMHVFEYAKIDGRFNEVFNKAMHNSSTLLMKRILDVYKGFDHINKLVDVGGGVGATIKLITSKHPHILGINFDLPHVIECASAYDDGMNELKGAILEGGIPFNRAHGMHVFEYAKIDGRFNEVFNKAMHNSSTLLMKRILDVYKGFDHINKLVDVGGGVGATIKLITSKHPHILGINFDLPHVIECASAYDDGVEHVGGDMFESVPNGDAIFMKRILYDWGDEKCLKILKNCLKAIPNDGKVIVVETMVFIVPEPTSFAKNAFGNDVIMMTQMPGGIERTKQDFMELAHGSGFSGIRFVCCVSSVWVMEFYK